LTLRKSRHTFVAMPIRNSHSAEKRARSRRYKSDGTARNLIGYLNDSRNPVAAVAAELEARGMTREAIYQQLGLIPAGKRTYKGEPEARQLVAWLNETKNSAAHGRVVRLIELFSALAAANELLTTAAIQVRPYLQVDRLQTQIDRILKGHVSCPRVWAAGPFGILVSRGVAGRRWDIADSVWPKNEFAAVEAVLSLVAIGVIDKLKVCRCGQWFFGRFAHTKFHTTKCQQQEHRQDEEYKEKRRRWARKNYRIHRDKNVK
jgi:hypothetical protein